MRAATAGLLTATLLCSTAGVATASPRAPRVVATANDSFVRAAFQDLLLRSASDSSVAYWSGRLAAGSSTKAQILHYLATSDAAYETIVYRTYAMVGRVPTPAQRAQWVGELRSRTITAAGLAEVFISTDAFVKLAGGGTTLGWIKALYQRYENTAHESAASDAKWVAATNAHGRLYVAKVFYESPTAEAGRATQRYYQMLGTTHAIPAASLRLWTAVETAHGDLAVAEGLGQTPEYATRALSRSYLKVTSPTSITLTAGAEANVALTTNLGTPSTVGWGFFGQPGGLSVVASPNWTLRGVPTRVGTYHPYALVEYFQTLIYVDYTIKIVS